MHIKCFSGVKNLHKILSITLIKLKLSFSLNIISQICSCRLQSFTVTALRIHCILPIVHYFNNAAEIIFVQVCLYRKELT